MQKYEPGSINIQINKIKIVFNLWWHCTCHRTCDEHFRGTGQSTMRMLKWELCSVGGGSRHQKLRWELFRKRWRQSDPTRGEAMQRLRGNASWEQSAKRQLRPVNQKKNRRRKSVQGKSFPRSHDRSGPPPYTIAPPKTNRMGHCYCCRLPTRTRWEKPTAGSTSSSSRNYFKGTVLNPLTFMTSLRTQRRNCTAKPP